MITIGPLDNVAWRPSGYYASRARVGWITIATVFVSLAIACAVAVVATNGSPLLVAPIVALIIAMAVVVRPVVGVYLLLAIGLLFEQYAIPELSPITVQAWVYQNISAYTEVPLRLSLVDLLMLLTLASLAARAIAARRGLRMGPFGRAFLAFMGLFAVGTVIGVARGGWSVDAALAEIRAPLYITLLYFLTANLVGSARQVALLAWIGLALVGVKALQGDLNYFEAIGLGVAPDAVTGHEDVVFFDLAIVAAAMAFVLRIRTKLAYAFFALLPLVLSAEALTQRRVGFVALGVAFAAVLLLALAADPRRGTILATVSAVLLGAYIVAFWGETGALGQPIRPLRALVEPSSVSIRDRMSNHWRDIENRNIKYTMRELPLTGVGVGQEYLFREEPPKLSGFAFWRYVTHNGLLWFWLKAGALGAFLLWFLFARILLLCSAMYRRLQDPELRWLAAMPIALVVIYATFSAVEIGFNYNRTAIVIGVVFGAVAFLSPVLASANRSLNRRAA